MSKDKLVENRRLFMSIDTMAIEDSVVITLSKDDLYEEVSLRTNISTEEVRAVIDSFIDMFLKKLKLK